MAHAEIELAYVPVGEQALRRAVVDDATVLHDVAVARDGQRGARVLLDEQHRQPQLVTQARDQGHEALDDQRCQAERELVDQQHARSAQQRGRQRQHLALAAREISRQLSAAAGEHGKVVEHLLERHRRARRATIGQRPRHERAQIFLDCQGLEDLVALGHQHEPAPRQLVRRAAGDGRALEHDPTADDLCVVSAEKARDRAERGRLAGAVGAEQRDDRARRHAERHALDRRRHMVVDDLEVLQLEQRRHDAERSGR